MSLEWSFSLSNSCFLGFTVAYNLRMAVKELAILGGARCASPTQNDDHSPLKWENKIVSKYPKLDFGFLFPWCCCRV